MKSKSMITWMKQQLQPSKRWRSTRKANSISFQIPAAFVFSDSTGRRDSRNPPPPSLCLHPPILSSTGPLWSKNRGRDTEKQAGCSAVCIPSVIYSIWEILRGAARAGSQGKRPVTALLPSVTTERARGTMTGQLSTKGEEKKYNTLGTWRSRDKKDIVNAIKDGGL